MQYTITTRTHSTYHDDYVYAICFDPETGEFSTKEIGGTAGAYAPDARPATATSEIIEQASKLLIELLIEDKIKNMTANRTAPVKGKIAKSLTTRGKNVGVTGMIMWMGPDEYQYGSIKVGIKVDGEKKLRYLPANRVALVEPIEIDPVEIREWAVREVDVMVNINNWYDTLRNLNLIHRM